MRRCRARWRGISLVELMAASAIAAVVMLIGMVAWQMGWRGVRDAQGATTAHQNAFSALGAIEEQVVRASTIQVPDPDNTGVPSIQLLIPNSGTTLRRAFRLVGGNLIMQRKDEGGGLLTVFSGVSALSFAILDAPTNSLVQITCSCTQGGRTVQMATVAMRRN